MIPFNVPLITGDEEQHVKQVLENKKFSGDGAYTKLCHQWLEDLTGTFKALLTTSCTHALEMAALLIDIQPGDEVIMPSFTFVSTANPFVLRGAKVRFVDVCPDTMNMDLSLVEAAITSKTKAIVTVHYGGVGCDMERLMALAEQHSLWVIEDAAQCMLAYQKGKHLGTFGHLGTLSFHDTKNIQCGEGGALLINDEKLMARAEIIREKGTNRAQFFRGEVDKYSWVDKGSSYLPSELNAAFLYAQFQAAEQVTDRRVEIWNHYYKWMKPLQEKGLIQLAGYEQSDQHNGHLFYIILESLEIRQALIQYLKAREVFTVFHYVPLHSAKAGLQFGEFEGEDQYTTIYSERLLRLPLWYGLTDEQIHTVYEFVNGFFNSEEYSKVVENQDYEVC